MKQAISTAISNAILDWRDGEVLALYQLPISITKSSVVALIKIAKENIGKKTKGKNLGARIIGITTGRKYSLIGCVNRLANALKGIAYEDAKLFDYIETLRIKAPTPEDEAIVVEILEITPKREAWV